ncbi:MAG: hypothetical protein VB876_02445, partial [Pirellulales bacterium]
MQKLRPYIIAGLVLFPLLLLVATPVSESPAPVGPLEIRHNYLDLSNAEASRTFTVLSPLPPRDI